MHFRRTAKVGYREILSWAPKTKWRSKLLEIAITLLLYHLGIKFQLLYLCFHGWPTRRNNNRHGNNYHTTKIQYGGYKTGSSFNSGYIPLRIEIPTAITMFLRVANTSE